MGECGIGMRPSSYQWVRVARSYPGGRPLDLAHMVPERWKMYTSLVVKYRYIITLLAMEPHIIHFGLGWENGRGQWV